jgi:hypothetical protein
MCAASAMAALMLAAICSADDCLPDGRTHGCPPSSYSRLHYWTPTLVRWWEHCRHYSVKCNGPWLYPEIEGEARILQYKCVPVDPAALPYGVLPPPITAIPVAPYGDIPPTRISTGHRAILQPPTEVLPPPSVKP